MAYDIGDVTGPLTKVWSGEQEQVQGTTQTLLALAKLLEARDRMTKQLGSSAKPSVVSAEKPWFASMRGYEPTTTLPQDTPLQFKGDEAAIRSMIAEGQPAYVKRGAPATVGTSVMPYAMQMLSPESDDAAVQAFVGSGQVTPGVKFTSRGDANDPMRIIPQHIRDAAAKAGLGELPLMAKSSEIKILTDNLIQLPKSPTPQTPEEAEQRSADAKKKRVEATNLEEKGKNAALDSALSALPDSDVQSLANLPAGQARWLTFSYGGQKYKLPIRAQKSGKRFYPVPAGEIVPAEE